MISVGSKLIVGDNSGAQVVRCIRILRKFRHIFGIAGDVVLVSIRRLRKVIKQRRVQIGSLYLGLIIFCRRILNRSYGVAIRGSQNFVVLLNKDLDPLSKRVHVWVSIELRFCGFMRVVLISRGTF